MSIREQVVQAIGGLNDDELREVADYLAFLKFRSRFGQAARLDSLDAADVREMALRYTEFAEEDRLLAEEGMLEYSEALRREDEA